MNIKTIYIIEDNELYAKSLQTFIANRFQQITSIKTFRIGELCLIELHNNPDIVIVDYYLNSKYPDALDGLEIIKQIKAKKPKTHIIVVSGQEKINVVSEAIKEYDCLYVEKDRSSFEKVAQHIDELLEASLEHTEEN